MRIVLACSLITIYILILINVFLNHNVASFRQFTLIPHNYSESMANIRRK